MAEVCEFADVLCLDVGASGEEAAVHYWQSRREPFLKLYEKKLESVETELKSPLLSYLSDESRGLTRKAALEDPDKALHRLSQLHASKQAEHEEKTRPINRANDQWSGRNRFSIFV